jgi:apocytochrome f
VQQWKNLCKLSFKSKAIEVEAPQAVLPNSVFEVAIKVPYDVNKQQIGLMEKADLNVGGILMLPKV